jgi:hypothetical protein
MEDFFKNTLQIGPMTKGIVKGRDIDENIMHSRNINVEKVVNPLKKANIDKVNIEKAKNKTSFSLGTQTQRV